MWPNSRLASNLELRRPPMAACEPPGLAHVLPIYCPCAPNAQAGKARICPGRLNLFGSLPNSILQESEQTVFSGLVESKTEVIELIQESEGVLLGLGRPTFFDDITLGDSIATNGCCLTVIRFDEFSMYFQAGEETLRKTNLGNLKSGDHVNCERSLALGDRIGGHLVSGHVDGVGKLVTREDREDWSDMIFECSSPLTKQMASKGSICVDGVSLTLVDVTESTFSVALIPHTLEQTTLGSLQIGSPVNLETDLLAKYVERQLQHSTTT